MRYMGDAEVPPFIPPTHLKGTMMQVAQGALNVWTKEEKEKKKRNVEWMENNEWDCICGNRV